VSVMGILLGKDVGLFFLYILVHPVAKLFLVHYFFSRTSDGTYMSYVFTKGCVCRTAPAVSGGHKSKINFPYIEK
jgi:hypothetical protein